VNDVDKLICDSLVYAYQKMDKDFYENVFKSLVSLKSKKIKNVGTCALTIVIYNQKIYVANCGDSEAIVVY
jgi:serine/threonine protein phosphatase PrpC